MARPGRRPLRAELPRQASGLVQEPHAHALIARVLPHFPASPRPLVAAPAAVVLCSLAGGQRHEAPCDQRSLLPALARAGDSMGRWRRQVIGISSRRLRARCPRQLFPRTCPIRCSSKACPRERVTPSGDTYTVQSGDSLYAIAEKLGTTVDELTSLNGLTSNDLSVGQVLRIPGSASHEQGSPTPKGSRSDANANSEATEATETRRRRPRTRRQRQARRMRARRSTRYRTATMRTTSLFASV